MEELLIASNNKHKVIEISHVISGDYHLKSLREAGFSGEIPEEQDTLEGNARQKAWYVFEKTGINCFADDTGLEVMALDGKPGVHSARYAELTGELIETKTVSESNILKLLDQMKGRTDRRARFRTIICLIINSDEYLFEGVVEGKIIEEVRGREGFGYDPVFVPDGFTTTFSEMSLEQKNKISHRARAVQKLSIFLKDRKKTPSA